MIEKKYRRPAEYPCGIADFPDLRNRGCVYVDKTDLLAWIIGESLAEYILKCRKVFLYL